MDASVAQRVAAALGLMPGIGPGVATPQALRQKADELARAYARMLEFRALVPAQLLHSYEVLLRDMRALAITIQAVTGVYDQAAPWMLALVGGARADVVDSLTATVSVGLYAALASMLARYNALLRAMPVSVRPAPAASTASAGLGTLDAAAAGGVSWTAILIVGGLVVWVVSPALRQWWKRGWKQVVGGVA